MEQNSTQGSDEPDTINPETAPVDVPPEANATPVEKVDKKTTIQVFTSTTEILTAEKRGNDTYDTVIRRDRKVIDALRKGYPDIYKALAGQQ